ncbi:DUF4359 domain-containing protein [Guptibacillus algicola]|uniref:DUF4359 domain-containing protein n=1 Tax=Guptibacillus algicola TaxID=225844 RepID=UPI001CD37B7B|nr:DUF4359 domain-containing protein [Alkalihalobacillus algicola]MCA0988401.1 DUF4359 domain-containing protein [Alkalihalobacillus algicola]
MKRTGLFICVLVMVGMLFTNPDTEGYVEWASDELKKDQNTLVEIGIDLAVVPYLSSNTERSNWYVFSLYRTKNYDGKIITSVGMMNHFFVLSSR